MKRDIAIIGMSGRFPKSDSVQQFWDNLVNGKELLHFFTDEELLARGVNQKDLENPNYVKVASYIDSEKGFDYPFFKYTLDEARVMNPQTRLFHHLVWEALEDAGCNPEKYQKKIGIFAGANNDLNWSFYSAMNSNPNVDFLMASKLSNPNFMASLVSYKLNLRGPCYFVDTACSTSLSTTHLACRSLLLNECSIAVVGGIRLLSHNDNGYQFHEGSIMSRDGRCRSFDMDSTGTMGCDGAGVVILKRLEAAMQDRDPIYAVIKASTMNNDGSQKGGYTMPSVQGQFECIKLAQRIAGVKPADFTYIETHGTGTKIGDPIEIEALNRAFDYATEFKCAIGSVKSNMGHADEAAGIAGLIKTALAIRHAVIPPSINYEKPNPTIPFNQGPFFVNTKATNWSTDKDKPRLAGVSSLGIGGTNVHMILAESPIKQRERVSVPSNLILYSASNEASLALFESKLLHFLNEDETVNLTNLAYTFQTGRKRFSATKFFVADSVPNAIDLLKDNSLKLHEVRPKKNLVFMFSGQGSQYSHMGIELYQTHALFREQMDQGFDYLNRLSGINFKEIVYGEEAIPDQINQTEYTQPILFLFEYSLTQLLKSFGLQPDFLIGHSLGEYVAACISGVFTLEEGLKLVYHRAKLMAQVEKGAMLGVGVSLEMIDEKLFENVAIAAINSPSSFVLSGSFDQIDTVKRQLDGLGISCVLLKTSHAFHSELMDSMVEDFAKVLREVQLAAPTIPVVSNLSGEFLTKEEAISVDYWTKHVRLTVNFERGLKHLIGLDNTFFLEVGPGKTLTTFYKQGQNPVLNNTVDYSVRHPKEKVSDHYRLANLLGRLWQNGFDLNWDTYYPEKPQKISAPTYVFNQHELVTKVSAAQLLNEEKIAPLTQKMVEDTFYLPSWKSYFNTYSENTLQENDYLIFSDGSELAVQLIANLENEGKQVFVVSIGQSYVSYSKTRIQIHPRHADNYERLADYLTEINFNYECIIYCWNLGVANSVESKISSQYQTYIQDFNCILNIVKVLNLSHAKVKKKILFLSHSNVEVIGNEKFEQLNNHVNSLLNTLAQECPNIYTGNIDVDLNDQPEKLADLILEELIRTDKYYQIAIRNRRKWTPYFESIPMIKKGDKSQKQLKKSCNVLITKATDYADLSLISYFLKQYDATIFVLRAHTQVGQDDILLKHNGIEQHSGKIVYVDCELSNTRTLQQEVEKIEATYGPINGVIHCAKYTKVNGLMPIDSIDQDAIQNHFVPRVDGFLNLISIFKGRQLDFALVLSSLSSFLGGIAYGAYATAGALMDELFLARKSELSNWCLINLDRIAEEDEIFINGDELSTIVELAINQGDFKQLIVSKRRVNVRADFLPKQASEGNAMVNRSSLKSEFKAANSPTEKKLLNLFVGLFGLKGIGVEDDFFDLGGDSLKAMMLINKIVKLYSLQLSVTDIFSNPSILQLAELIEEKQWLSTDKKSVNELVI